MPALSLRDAIKGAIEEHDEEPAEAAAAPAAEAGEASGEAQAAPAEEASAPPLQDKKEAPDAARADADGAQPREPDGKFGAKDKAAQSASSEPAPVADAAPPAEGTSRIPPGLPPALKAAWKDLPEDWRKEYLRQEDSFRVVRDAWQPKAERLNRIDAIIEPRREKLKFNGVSDDQWVERLAAAEDLLERNPVDGLLYLARAYNADPRQLMARLTGSQGGPAPQLPPELQQLYSEVSTLKQTLAQQQQAAAEAGQAAAQGTIDAFRADPANLYFDNVKEDVAQLLLSGRATDLKSAYETACWANPEVRALLVQEREAQAASKATASQARAKAAAAAQAAGSITGAPGSGSLPAGSAEPKDLRGTIRAAIQSQAGEV